LIEKKIYCTSRRHLESDGDFETSEKFASDERTLLIAHNLKDFAPSVNVCKSKMSSLEITQK
jgi:hypothetical protein